MLFQNGSKPQIDRFSPYSWFLRYVIGTLRFTIASVAVVVADNASPSCCNYVAILLGTHMHARAHARTHSSLWGKHRDKGQKETDSRTRRAPARRRVESSKRLRCPHVRYLGDGYINGSTPAPYIFPGVSLSPTPSLSSRAENLLTRRRGLDCVTRETALRFHFVTTSRQRKRKK